MIRPNLFDYATSELSQDAIICWLLSWGSPDLESPDSQLHEISIKLLKAFFNKHSQQFPLKIEKLKVIRQKNNIDILLILNDTIAIPIEDKIHIREHSDQLSRYLKTLKEEGKYQNHSLLPIYMQTGEQGDYHEVEKAGFIPFLRLDMLKILIESEPINNHILTDYLSYLKQIEFQVSSFNSINLNDWGWYSWPGFFNYLKKEIHDGTWKYISNPRGGFCGFYWHWKEDNECKQYLQLENDKLCFKIYVEKPENQENQSALKRKWSENIIEAGKHSSIEIFKPVLRNGTSMTVASMKGDYRQKDSKGKIDLKKTIDIIYEAQKILDKAVEV